MNVGDLLWVINEGRIEDSGPPSRVYLRPRTRFVATFMGESNLIDGRVVSRSGGRVVVDTALGPLACDAAGAGSGDAPQVMFRPEKVRILNGAAPADAPRVRITGRSFQGSGLKLWARAVAAPEVEILIKAANDCPLTEGDVVPVAVPPEAVLLFARDPKA